MCEDIFAKESYSDVVTFLDNDEKYSLEMYTSFGEEEFIKTFVYLIRIFLERLKSGDDYKV